MIAPLLGFGVGFAKGNKECECAGKDKCAIKTRSAAAKIAPLLGVLVVGCIHIASEGGLICTKKQAGLSLLFGFVGYPKNR